MASEIFSLIASATSKLHALVSSSIISSEDVIQNLKDIKELVYEAKEQQRKMGDQSINQWLKQLKAVAVDAEDLVEERLYDMTRIQVEDHQRNPRSIHHTKGKNEAKKDGERVISESSAFSRIIRFDIPINLLERIENIRYLFGEISKGWTPQQVGQAGKKSLDLTNLNVCLHKFLTRGEQLLPRTSSRSRAFTVTETENFRELVILFTGIDSDSSVEPTNRDLRSARSQVISPASSDPISSVTDDLIMKNMECVPEDCIQGDKQFDTPSSSSMAHGTAVSQDTEALCLLDDDDKNCFFGYSKDSSLTNKIFGRDQDKENIIQWLLFDASSYSFAFTDGRRRSKFSVISIVGTAGVGKTTLAKLVYDDPVVCEHFSARGWIHVGNDSSVARLSKAILSSITGKSCDEKEPNDLQTIVQRELAGKRLLLVLDDIEDLNPSLWKTLQATLCGVRIVKFIITSPNEGDGNMWKLTKIYHLDVLPLDLSWDLFHECAFLSARAFYRGYTPPKTEIVDIGKKIVQKCKGLPLALKTLGSILSYQTNKQTWVGALESTLWDSTKIGYKFEKYELVRLWMALQYIASEGSKRVEDIACRYFYELQRMSFFEKFWDGTFIMHDLIYNLSELMSEGECISIQGDMDTISDHVCHLHVLSCKRTHKSSFLEVKKNLRTFFCQSLDGTLPKFLKIPSDMTMQYLRALVLKVHGDSGDFTTNQEATLKQSKASSIMYSRFIHLRHLQICDKSIIILPTSVCQLYNLQTLILNKCFMLRELPKELGNLLNLQCLAISESSIKRLPESVSQLFNLESLILDYCRNFTDLPFRIQNLTNLHYVGLSGTSVGGLHESISDLQKLSILKLNDCKMFMELPNSIRYLTNLQSIQITHAKLQRLPESVCHLPKLRLLDLSHSMVVELPSGIGELVELGYLGVSHTNICDLPESLCQLSSLHTLKLNGCRNLSNLPSGIGALKNLHNLILSGTDIEELPVSLCQLWNLQTLELDGCTRFFRIPSHIGDLTNLCRIKLSDTAVTELPSSLCQLPNLQMLDLNGCHKLSQLPSGIGNLSNLYQLEITETSIRELPKSLCQLSQLRKLNLNGNSNLQELPSNIENLVNLRQLELSEVGIEVLPKSIAHLSKLYKLSFEYQQTPIASYLTRVEDIACRYFYELQRMPFFEKSWDGTFITHDLIYNLSELMSEGECISIQGDMDTISDHVCHLHVLSCKRTHKSSFLEVKKNLRTFFCQSLDGTLPKFLSISSDMTMSYLRALVLKVHGDS
ncbi:hypothetical protein ZIOFF_067826 [Zingiber officinale]|uniref:Uncharacterized protein n=2 Tax=Zingiber officinale TaxID=94328 RepID=A0A8J5CDU9_ZINOF|nr:hypothetical protein ZIOFF_067826 [Zingiber officinale]